MLALTTLEDVEKGNLKVTNSTRPSTAIQAEQESHRSQEHKVLTMKLPKDLTFRLYWDRNEEKGEAIIPFQPLD